MDYGFTDWVDDEDDEDGSSPGDVLEQVFDLCADG